MIFWFVPDMYCTPLDDKKTQATPACTYSGRKPAATTIEYKIANLRYELNGV